MLRIIGIMLSGVLIGYILRNRNLGFISKLITIAIWILLFLLGTAVGTNDEILGYLDTIGVQAFILSAGATLGSAACAWIVYRFLWLKKKP